MTNMNYNNTNMNSGYNKNEEGSLYVRNNYASNTNDNMSNTYNKGSVVAEDGSTNNFVYNQIRNNKREMNHMVANNNNGSRNYSVEHLNPNNENVGLNDTNNNSSNNNNNNNNNNNSAGVVRNVDNNRSYMNYVDKNNNPENMKNSFGNNKYYDNQGNNENNMMHDQMKGGLNVGGMNSFNNNNVNNLNNMQMENNRLMFDNNNNNNNKRNNNFMNNNNNNNNNGRMEKPRYKPPMLRNQGNFHNNRNNFNRMNFNKGGGNNNFNNNSNNNNSFPRNYTIPQTAWATRDNRRYYPEKEEEIYSNVKSEKGVNFDLYNSIPVEISGYNSENVAAIETFDDPSLNLNELLLSNIKKVNYDKTTPIQKYSLNIIMNRNDLIGVAQTGSGKTAGYLLPIINHMLINDPPKHTYYEQNNKTSNYYFNRVCLPICLILAPTRELAVQIFYDAKKFCFETGIKPVVLYGGNNIKTQLSNLDKGADIIVATPGRLNDILEKGKIKLFLTTFLVLDEADRMLDMGFSPQIRSIVNDYDMPGNDNDVHTSENKVEYKKYCNDIIKRQTIMFSATFRKEIQVLAKEYLCKYTFLLVGKVGSTNEYIKQNLVFVEEENKCNYLLNLLAENNNGLTILFVETKRKADIIERFLSNQKLNAVCIHGDKSQDERERALKLFKRGIKNILVATDVAARGLDISNIKHVINFDLPSNIDDYIHRIGRTGRAGNIGIATSFVNEDNKNIFKDLLATLEECNQQIPRWFLNLVMKHTASARANRNYKYKFMKNKNNFNNRFNNNNNMDNRNFHMNNNMHMNNNSNNNNNPFNNNKGPFSNYNQQHHHPFNNKNNNAFNNNNNAGTLAFGNNPFNNNNMYPNNNNNNNNFPYNNNNNPFNNNKYNNNFKKFDDQKFQRNNFQNVDDNNNEAW
ncbi:RNA helicase, putative [Plasmodium sp. gorilla clade G3]|nr:RNA helicase, putative [Plasmodium sp. gorilla clade G3]